MATKKPTSVSDSLEVVYQSVVSMWEAFLSHLPLLIAGIVVLIVTFAMVRATRSLLRRFLETTNIKRGLRDLIEQLGSLAVWVLGLTVTTVVVFPGMTPTKVLAGLGLGSIALGFAFKDIIENFLAGILILWRFPFDPGDYIRWGDIVGRVEEVTIRMTLMRLPNGELVILPNAKLFKDPVHVLTSGATRRVSLMCGVGYSEKLEEVHQVLEGALQCCATVALGKPVEVYAREFGDSSINFELLWWCKPTPKEVNESVHEVILAIKARLDESEIEIPFPHRTLTFGESARVQMETT